MTGRPVQDAVPIEPFAGWCRDAIERYGDTSAAANACHVDESQLRRWAQGNNSNMTGTISIRRVDEVLVTEGTTNLNDLYPPSKPVRYRGGGKPVGKWRKMTDKQIRTAHRIYVKRGLSVRELSELLWERFGYKSPESCKNCLFKAFRTLGLPLRSQSEVTIKRNFKHGRAAADQDGNAYKRWMRAQRARWCQGVLTAAAGEHRAGAPCSLPALADSDYCYGHDPRRKLQAAAHLARGRAIRNAQRETVPLEPFARWLRALVDELGSDREAARMLGCSYSTISNIRRGIRTDNTGPAPRKMPWIEIGRDRVEHYLGQVDGAPTFDELYTSQRETVAA